MNMAWFRAAFVDARDSHRLAVLVKQQRQSNENLEDLTATGAAESRDTSYFFSVQTTLQQIIGLAVTLCGHNQLDWPADQLVANVARRCAQTARSCQSRCRPGPQWRSDPWRRERRLRVLLIQSSIRFEIDLRRPFDTSRNPSSCRSEYPILLP